MNDKIPEILLSILGNTWKYLKKAMAHNRSPRFDNMKIIKRQQTKNYLKNYLYNKQKWTIHHIAG